MDNLFEVVKIEGKGLGCIALKDIKLGTLILEEKPQICASSAPFAIPNGPTKPITLQNLMESFQKMSLANQKEFLTLHNKNIFKKFTDEEWKILQTSTTMSHEETNKWKEILEIYETNTFGMGVGIQSSRFNHSCVSNAEFDENKITEAIEIRAVSNIKAGDEITIKYAGQNDMKKLNTRRENFLKRWNFQCHCHLCEEETEKCSDEKYEQFEKLKREATSPSNIERKVQCYKEMYKLAKEKQASRSFILSDILDKGFYFAVQGYLQVI